MKFFSEWLAAASLLLFSATLSAAPLYVPFGTILSIGSGSLAAGTYDIVVDGTLVITDGTINIRSLTIGSTGTLHAGGGSIEVTGNWTNNGNFLAGSGTVYFLDDAATSVSINGTNTFNNLVITSSIGKSISFPSGELTTITGDLRATGTPSNLVVLKSSNPGAGVNLLVGGSVLLNDAVFDELSATQSLVAVAVPTLGFSHLALLVAGLFFVSIYRVRISPKMHSLRIVA